MNSINKSAESFILDAAKGVTENGYLKTAENICIDSGKAVSRKGMRVCAPLHIPEAQNAASVIFGSPYLFYGGEYKKVIILRESDEATYAKYIFKLAGSADTAQSLGAIRFNAAGGVLREPISAFIFSANAIHATGLFTVFGFLEDGEYSYKIYEYLGQSWTLLNSTDMYLPTVYKNGRGSFYTQSGKTLPAPEFYEQPNILSDRKKYTYNADGVSETFYLPLSSKPDFTGSAVYCTVETPGGTLTFTIGENSQISEGVIYEGETVKLGFDRTQGKMQFTDFAPPFIDGGDNTVSFTLIKPNSENAKKIATISQCVWYDAGNSGTRLCFAGSGELKSMLLISAPDNPFYIPGDNVFFIGDPTQKITALAKQNKSLVVFKEKEMYCGTFSSGKFSINHLHSAIGCDLPATVALCGNRIVWATSDKRIYTLNALSDYGAVAVYCLSDSIKAALTEKDFSAATAVYCDEIYYLFLGHEACIMNVSGALLQSNKEFLESAVFTFWRLPQKANVCAAFSAGSKIKAVCETLSQNYQLFFIGEFTDKSGEDEILISVSGEAESVKIPYKSKLSFVYVSPGARRSYYKGYISCYAEKGAAVKFISGDTAKKISIDMKYTALKLPAPYRLLPMISGRVLGTVIETEGEFAFSGLTLYCKDFI